MFSASQGSAANRRPFELSAHYNAKPLHSIRPRARASYWMTTPITPQARHPTAPYPSQTTAQTEGNFSSAA